MDEHEMSLMPASRRVQRIFDGRISALPAPLDREAGALMMFEAIAATWDAPAPDAAAMDTVLDLLLRPDHSAIFATAVTEGMAVDGERGEARLGETGGIGDQALLAAHAAVSQHDDRGGAAEVAGGGRVLDRLARPLAHVRRDSMRGGAQQDDAAVYVRGQRVEIVDFNVRHGLARCRVEQFSDLLVPALDLPSRKGHGVGLW